MRKGLLFFLTVTTGFLQAQIDTITGEFLTETKIFTIRIDDSGWSREAIVVRNTLQINSYVENSDSVFILLQDLDEFVFLSDFQKTYFDEFNIKYSTMNNILNKIKAYCVKERRLREKYCGDKIITDLLWFKGNLVVYHFEQSNFNYLVKNVDHCFKLTHNDSKKIFIVLDYFN
jgi:hypothetical protein